MLTLTLLTSCGEYQKLLKSRDPEQKYQAALQYFNQKQYVKAGNVMALRFLGQMYHGENFICSPLSLQYALAMTQKYEPERSAALMAGITGRATEPKRGRVQTESGREDRRMEKARARASGAGQPGGGR